MEQSARKLCHDRIMFMSFENYRFYAKQLKVKKNRLKKAIPAVESNWLCSVLLFIFKSGLPKIKLEGGVE